MTYTYDAGTSVPNLAGLVEFNGVRINNGTFTLTRAGGLIDASAPVRQAFSSLPSDSGSFAGTPFYDGIDVQIEGVLTTPLIADLWGAIDHLRATFNLHAGMQTLVFNTTSWATRRQVLARVAGPIVVQEPDGLQKNVPDRNFYIPMIAPDPIAYDADNARTTTINVGSTGTVTNSGTIEVPYAANLWGPATNPTLTCVTTGQSITLNTTIPAGSAISIGTNPVTGIQVFLTGGANRYSTVTAFTAMTIPVGASTWSYSASGTTGATQAFVFWRDGWA